MCTGAMVNAENSPHVAVLGEALVDVIANDPSNNGADTALAGGSPLNVAVGLSRLGFHATLHSRVGTDDYGALIQQHLEKENVTLPSGFTDAGRTSTATVTLDPQGVASYTFDLVWDIDAPDTSGAGIVHTGSIGAVVEPGGLRTYDPNIRADIMGEPSSVRAHVYGLAASYHVVKLSDKDAAWIGEDAGLSAEALQRIAGSGPRFAVLTTGEHGCLAIVDGRTHQLPARPVELVDTIGAGDAFMSGLIFALAKFALAKGGLGELLLDDATAGETPPPASCRSTR